MQVIVPHRATDSHGNEILEVTMDCDLGTAKCLKITCQVFALKAGASATVEVRSRLWNSTLAEDYAGVDAVRVFSKAKVTLDATIAQNVSDDYVSVRTDAFPDGRGPKGASRPPWWVVLLAVLLGLLLLVVIALALWRCGFFERRRPTPEEDDTDFMMSAHFEKVRLNDGDL